MSGDHLASAPPGGAFAKRPDSPAVPWRGLAMKGKVKMVTQDPTDRNSVSWLHRPVAWSAARAVARETHHAVILFGEFGTARFNRDGGGSVEWNERSNSPGLVTEFAPDCTVCI